MKIELKTMALQNFKGVLGDRTYTFNEGITRVFGRNETGKTTIMDAFRWCLFGKNSKGSATFGVKTKVEGKVVPNLDHSVKLELLVDGMPVSLQRVLQEKWGKGKQKQLVGHTTIYFVNGQKYTERDYKQYIDELCNESLFMAITNPYYFTSLKADQQRTLLTQMVGEVSNEQLAEGNEQFQWLLKQMQGQELEQYMQHLRYRKDKVTEELERIPIRLKSQQQDIADLQAQGTNWEELEKEMASINSAIQRIDDELVDRSKVEDRKYDELQQQRKAINILRSNIEEAKDKHRAALQEEQRKLQQAESEAKQRVQAIEQQQGLNKRELDIASQYLQQDAERRGKREAEWEKRIADFRTRWAAASAEQFNVDANSEQFVCPTCHRRYEAEDIDKAIEDMRQSWNTQYAASMEALKAEAARIKQEQQAEQTMLDNTTAEYKASLEQAEGKAKALQEQLEQAKLDYDKAVAAPAPQNLEERYAADERIKELEAEVERREQAMQEPAEQQPVVDASASLKADKAQLMQQRDEKLLLLNNRKLIAGKEQRIAEITNEEAELNEQLDELEHEQYVAQQLLEANITELESKVNSLFDYVKFEMFDHKLNGTLKPTCECSYKGIPFSDLNDAARTNAGIDIINAISKHNDAYAPCFIDNAESVNEVLPMQAQQICLTATLTDYELRFE